MKKPLAVIIVDQDAFSCEMLSLLLARDWRTRVFGRFRNLPLSHKNTDRGKAVDACLINVDAAGDLLSLAKRISLFSENFPSVRIVALTTKVTNDCVQWLSEGKVQGYLLKDEIRFF